MIQKLVYETHKDGNGNVYGAIPSDAEIIDKINEVIDYINSRPEEKLSEDLEEAAEISFDEARALTEDYRDFLAKGLTENRHRPIGPHWFCEYAKNRFIAGAEWQKQRDAELIEIAYKDGITIGKTKQKEQMMKDAVEGEVIYDLGGFFRIKSEAIDGAKYKVGSWVKLIIVKED